MPVEIQSTPSAMTAYLSGEIDHHQAPAIRLKIDDAVQRQKPPLLKLDFGDVEFMDSSGVGLVMGRYRLVKSYGGGMEVVNLPIQIYKVMKLSGIEKLATIKLRKEAKK